jgi:hypothetical protein
MTNNEHALIQSALAEDKKKHAVEFLDWAKRRGYYKDVNGEWYGTEGFKTVLIAKSTIELYNLFNPKV